MDNGEITKPTRRDQDLRSHDLEVGSMRKYKGVFEHLIPQVESHVSNPDRLSSEYIFNVIGEHEGTRYQVRFPHLRRGKHAFVGIIDLNNVNGETESAVMRNDVEDARAYAQVASAHPIARSLVPELYGISGDWVFMERLYGLELEELTTRLAEDPDFRAEYVRTSFDLIEQVAGDGLQSNDVSFVNGHNVMINPNDAGIRLVEQKTLVPTLLDYNEVITDKLFGELMQVSNKPEGWRVDYAMQLLAIAMDKVGAENLFLKGRVIRPTNRNYRDAYYLERWEKLSDEEYQKILDNPVAREQLTISWFGRGFTEVISDETWEAVKEGDVNKFKEAIHNRGYRADIKDKEDPRYGVVILPDNFE